MCVCMCGVRDKNWGGKYTFNGLIFYSIISKRIRYLDYDIIGLGGLKVVKWRG